METYFGDRLFLEDGPSLAHQNSAAGGFFYDALLSKSGPALVSQSLQEFDQKTASSTLEEFGRSALSLGGSSKLLAVTDPASSLTVTESDLEALRSLVKKYTASKVPFERLAVTREFAAAMFCYNPIKLNLLSRISPTDTPTLYRCGDFIDLCRGPHVAHSGQLQAFKILRTGSVHLGSDHSVQVSRVYGVSFPKTAQLKDWELVQEEAAKRDHRVIGKQQGLFMMSPLAPGSAFMLPHGTRIANRLLEFIRAEYRSNGYEEVVTPLMFNKEVWETSGHWENYKEDMFLVSQEGGGGCSHGRGGEEEDTVYGLKPMNCPGHCVLFDTKSYSYRDLPVRIAEFSPLHRQVILIPKSYLPLLFSHCNNGKNKQTHRNEASGALTGLTRVRKFHQDDAHIFCTQDQVLSEIRGSLSFIDRVYKALGFPSYSLALSTRPEKYIGSTDQWHMAENSLRRALEETGRPISLKEGDGAFYGPKIDVMVSDALRRSHQTATIQLDFQLPVRFNLSYVGVDGSKHTPVMIHRAALGSVERMMAILMEHHGGRWPFWLSPRQAVVIPATSASHVVEYAEKVAKALSQGRASLKDEEVAPGGPFYYVDARTQDTDATLAKRVRDAWASRYNFVVVVGEREVKGGSLSVRTMVGDGTRDVSAEMRMDELLASWSRLVSERR
ncbi:54S ribosomal protein L39, mitochondrial [Dinochytrium kinnereticum]|nr:54S ribosomal protein L39, mitochondrial [Dinochytrium kinnereticum]